METILTDKQNQVIAQCKAVAHLASALAKIHNESADIYAQLDEPPTLDIVGERTAFFMEQLGDWLNEMDAVSEEDD